VMRDKIPTGSNHLWALLSRPWSWVTIEICPYNPKVAQLKKDSRLSNNPKVHCSIHKSPQLIPILSQKYLDPKLWTNMSTIYFNIILQRFFFLPDFRP
jgi:hypothetical protein